MPTPYVIPKIVYGSTTLSFSFPPVQKPMIDDREAVRHDSMSSSGLRQVALERIDVIKVIQMEYVPWDDLPNWQTFIDYALTGASFAYYPDATATAFQTWELLDTNFNPTFNVRGLTKFTLKFRLVPGGASSA